MDENDVVRRDALYAKVWEAIKLLAVDAAPGSIAPETLSRIAVDIVMAELQRAGVIKAIPNQSAKRL